MPTTVVHISDIHFGRIRQPGIVDALRQDVGETRPDLVVISGDLTQRARRAEYRAAAVMMASFDAPTLVVPGNHDVYAWWYAPFRLSVPLRRFRRFISDDFFPSFENDDIAVLGLNSAFGWTVKGGRIKSSQIESARKFFSAVDPEKFKILVVHHHLTRLGGLGDHDTAWNGRRALSAMAECGVRLVLCGHLHVPHVEDLAVARRSVIFATAGTATSDRGRGQHRLENHYNIVNVDAVSFVVEERVYDVDASRFRTLRTRTFDRTGATYNQT